MAKCLTSLTGSTSFSPLFVGPGVAISCRAWRSDDAHGFSPLFVGAGVAIRSGVSSGATSSSRFSPLFVGAGVAMRLEVWKCKPSTSFQSPICRGRRCNR